VSLEYPQALFIANKIYPIAYNKWITNPDLHLKLLPILSVANIKSNEINDKGTMVREFLNDLTNE